MVNEIIPRYSYNDYTKTPRGPLAIFLKSVDMPGPMNSIRDRINSIILKSNSQANIDMNKAIETRIQELVKGLLKKSNKDVSQASVTDLVSKLNVEKLDRFSTSLWNLKLSNKTQDIQIAGLIKSLEALKKNVDSLKSN